MRYDRNCLTYFLFRAIHVISCIKIWYDDGSIIMLWLYCDDLCKYVIIKYLFGLNFFFFMKIRHKTQDVSFSRGFLLVHDNSAVYYVPTNNGDLLTYAYFVQPQSLRPDVDSILHINNNNFSIVINKQKLTFPRRL